jgi:hypothetical protein
MYSIQRLEWQINAKSKLLDTKIQGNSIKLAFAYPYNTVINSAMSGSSGYRPVGGFVAENCPIPL